MPVSININSDAVVRYTQKLETLKKSALPVAVRTALNSTAFDVKKNTMPASAKSSFVQRAPNFFKANSRVEMAKGFDITKMAATVGFVGKVGAQGADQAVADLEQQEHGGNIGGRAFVPLKFSRISKSWRKRVLAADRPAVVAQNRIVDANRMKGKSKRERWNKAAIKAGPGGYVIGTTRTSRGNRILFQIKDVKQHTVNGPNGDTNYTFVEQRPLFAVKGGRIVKPSATHFMRTASMKSAKDMEKHFIEAAQKQVGKLR